MKDHTPLDRPRSILDPMHGLIRFTDEEFRVIEHPAFQRLGRIKQNGLLHFVFPGATHTRFEHSLGVLHVADAMLRSLVSNSRVAAKKEAAAPISSATAGQAVDLSELGDKDSAYLYRITRLAALVHDLGHGPLSHTFDKFALSNLTLRKLVDDPAIDALQALEQVLVTWKADDGTSPVKHEVMSCVFFAHAWRETGGDPETALAVAAAVLGPETYPHLTDLAMKRFVPLAHDVIASAPADADRMDYMERDSRSIGVTYGLFDRNRVLKSLLCYKEASESDYRFRLGLKRSGLRAVENLMQARFQLYMQIYYHKTNVAIQMMLKEIATQARKRGIFVVTGNTVGAVAESYYELDDEQFLRTLRGKVGGVLSGVTEINGLAEDVARRRLWKRIDECQTKTEAETVRAHLETQRGVLAGSIRVDTQDPEATKDLAEGAKLLERDGTWIYSTSGAPNIVEASRLIRSLQEVDQKAIRVYLAKGDSGLAGELRRSVWSFPPPRER